MRGKLLFAGLGVLALAAGALWTWGGASEPPRAPRAAKREGAARAAVASSARRPRAAAGREAGKRVAAPAPADGLSEAGRRLADEVQNALDGEDFAAVRRLAERLRGHPEAEVRLRAVEALGWFGEKALGDLTPYLADADADVKEAAMGAVEQALAQTEDEGERIAYAESVMSVRGACTEDGLEMLAGQLRGVSDEAAAVAAAVRVIASGTNPAAAAAMREVYEFLTGEPYTTPEAAARWRAEKAAEGD